MTNGTRIFEDLSAINVNDKVEEKQGLKYLSWSWAWSKFKKLCPDASYSVTMFDAKPYIYDELTGYMVMTTVCSGEESHAMWLPVMDSANKAMKSQPYTYMVKGWNGKPPTEKTVLACTMFDINKAIMRCLVKNIAMFGLGLYIYESEDLPESMSELEQQEKRKYGEGTCVYCKEKKLYATGEKAPKPQYRCECGAAGWLNGDKITWKEKK